MPKTTELEALNAIMGARQLRAVAPSDSTPLPNSVCDAIYIGVGGDISIIAEDDSVAVTLVGVPSGVVLPVRARQVMATGTTAASIVALY